MRIACSRCEARYELPEGRLDRGPVKIRCSRCGHVFAVRRRNESPEPSANEFLGATATDELRLGTPSETPGPTAPPPPDSALSANFDDFDFGAFEGDAGAATSEVPAKPQAEAPPESGFDDFDFASFEGGAPGSEPPSRDEPPAEVRPDASFDDFDLTSFEGTPESPASPPPAEPQAPAAGESASSLFDDELPPLGELDLGEFEEPHGSLGEGSPGPATFSAHEPERVGRDELVSTARTGTRALSPHEAAEEAPRLDLQKGPRRETPAGGPSRLVPRDRRRSPMTWVVALVALGTAAFTGYNLYRHPEALELPSRIHSWWLNRDVEAKFATEDVKGYPQMLPGGRRVFVVRGVVVNRSTTPQGLIRVRASLFGGGKGELLATHEVYCGNAISERELATLSRAAVEARLQNQVGKELSNVDIAPGGKVPFMVVFFSPPAGVGTFNVLVTASRTGSGA